MKIARLALLILIGVGCSTPGASRSDGGGDALGRGLDAGTGDVGPDAVDSGATCTRQPSDDCFEIESMGEFTNCGEPVAPICVGGYLRCPDHAATWSTCNAPRPPPFIPADAHTEANTDARADATADASFEASFDASFDASSDASSDASCNVGCAPSSQGSFCQAGEVQWACQNGPWDFKLFEANCRDAGTNLQRYCCPPTFLSMCQ